MWLNYPQNIIVSQTSKIANMFQPSMAKALVLLHLALLSLVSQKFHFTSSNPTGFALKLIPRDSPESPLYPGNITQAQKLERLVRFSKGRAQYLKFSLSSLNTNNATSSIDVIKPEDAIMPLYRTNFYYVVQTQLGTPPTVLMLIMDTGGGLVWTQCLPCIRCYKQLAPLYDSRDSSSYRKLPCSHFLCNGPEAPYQCVNNECVYSVTYGGGAGPTKGIASVETIQFSLSSGGVQAIDGIVFGCSNDNVNIHFEGTSISGIMGLSWAPDSLVGQLAPFVNSRFSYCFIPFDEGGIRSSLLTFGSAIPLPKGNILTTNFVPPPSGIGNYYFYLNLLDISVGWEKLGFPPDTFKLNPDGSGGLIIDSGAPLSILNNQDLPNGRNPYKEVIGAFQSKYDSLKLKRKQDPFIPDGLCYELPEDFKDFVPMTYHLKGADYVVDGKYVNYFNREEGHFCVALLSESGRSLLGAWHQQNTRIIYDGNIFAMQFSSEVCE